MIEDIQTSPIIFVLYSQPCQIGSLGMKTISLIDH
jgi:hypothetical protein